MRPGLSQVCTAGCACWGAPSPENTLRNPIDLEPESPGQPFSQSPGLVASRELGRHGDRGTDGDSPSVREGPAPAPPPESPTRGFSPLTILQGFEVRVSLPPAPLPRELWVLSSMTPTILAQSPRLYSVLQVCALTKLPLIAPEFNTLLI